MKKHEAEPSVKVGDGAEALVEKFWNDVPGNFGQHEINAALPALVDAARDLGRAEGRREVESLSIEEIRQGEFLDGFREGRRVERAEAATVPCEACGGRGNYCTAAGCWKGRVDARLAVAGLVEVMLREDGHAPAYYEALHDLRSRALAKYGPEAKETT